MAQGPDDEPIAMRVIEVHDDAFIVDTNHPLAGQKVRFEVTVRSVREATEEEIAEAEADLEGRAEDAEERLRRPRSRRRRPRSRPRPRRPAKLVQLSKKTLS